NNWGISSANGGTPGVLNNWLLSTSSGGNATSTPAAATSTAPLIALGTDVSATTTISQNTTWALTGSPYRLFFDSTKRPTVALGATLTIEPGVKIIPQGGGATALEIQGTLNAIATSGAPIIFTSIADADNNASTTPQKGDWLNIVFSQGSQANLDYVEFHYGGQGNTLPLHEMVNITGATVNINHSTFTNSQNVALHLMDSSGVVENSIFSDNNCGISVDSSNGIAQTSYGGCYGLHTTGQILSSATLQINNNQFTRNQNIGIEFRSGTAPTVNNNVFTDNGYPVKIESSYPNITNSKIANSTTSTNFLSGIAISGYTHFSHDFSLKKDLPYILETNGPALSPYIDLGAILTLEPGVIFKIGHIFTALNINGSLIASSTPDDPIVFTSFKDDLIGGDTNGDGSTSSPQDNDWASVKFFTGSIGNFYNTLFKYCGFGSPPVATTTSSKLIVDFPLISDVSNQNCDATTSKINPDSNGNFSKVIIHKLTNNNPIDKIEFLLGEANTEFGNYATHEKVIVNNPSYSNSEIELNFNSGFNAGFWYRIRLLGIAGDSIATSCDWGTDAMGNLASAWYKLVTTVSNPTVSVDPGASVTIDSENQ
ncbi:MAG: right-handed parallel beta-helix repeat-containing protein, partial [Patescibacteria group bacterium]